MSERRSVIVPPEMTNGSTSASVSSNSSVRTMVVIALCLLVSEPYPDPKDKRNQHEQSGHRQQRLAPTRRDQPCYGTNGDAQHDHLEVYALDPIARWKPPDPIGEESDDPEASQHRDEDPANRRLPRINGPAPRQHRCESQERQPSQSTPLVQRFTPGTRSRKCNSPPRRSSAAAASRSSITAI